MAIEGLLKKTGIVLSSILLVSALETKCLAEDNNGQVNAPESSHSELKKELTSYSISQAYSYISKAKKSEGKEKIKFIKKACDEINSLRLETSNPYVFNLKGDFLLFGNNYKEAIEQFSQASKLQPKNKTFLINKAFAQYMNNEFNDAIISYNSVLTVEANNKYALRGIAWSNMKLGNLDEAEKYYQKTIEAAPDFYDAHNDYGFFLLEQKKNPEKAIIEFSKAIEINPKMPNAYDGREKALKIIKK